jgi:uncharacterized protein (DUF1697 family)
MLAHASGAVTDRCGEVDMARYVAFLRAINVGGHTVKMNELQRLFERWGGTNVETFIASGNVVFDTSRRSADAAERSIEDHLQKALGYPVVTFLRTLPELVYVAGHAPFPQSEYSAGATLFVGFMKGSAAPSAARAVASLRSDVDDYAIEGREIYWLRRRQLMESVATGPSLDRIVGSPITMRNVNTVRRLAAKYCAQRPPR